MWNKIVDYFKKLKGELTSRTIKAAYALQILSCLQVALPEMRDLLGVWYGVTLFAVGELIKYYRRITTTPIGERIK